MLGKTASGQVRDIPAALESLATEFRLVADKVQARADGLENALPRRQIIDHLNDLLQHLAALQGHV